GNVSTYDKHDFYPALMKLSEEFDVSEVAVNSLGNFQISNIAIKTKLQPIAWAAYSDRFATRRKVYLLSILVFIIPTILCSLAKKFWQLMILCAIQSCGSSALISISAGIISDIHFSMEEALLEYFT
ncbi:4726_t:CDS:2, partial [Gigaspora rosea]